MSQTKRSCPVCKHHTDRFDDAKEGIVYHHCQHCGYIFKDPMHHQSLQEQKHRYDLHQNNPEDNGYRLYFQKFLDFILPQIPEGGTVLDFGCGASTLLSDMMAELGFRPMPYDPIYHPSTSFGDRRYDLIVSTEVFEHLDDPMGTLAQLVEMLGTNGYLALQTQFHLNDKSQFLSWYYRLDPTHIGFFAPDTFRYMTKRLGLKYVSDDGINKVLMMK